MDTETGRIRLTKLVSATDAGKAINPVAVEGQIEGGAAMGLGYGLYEQHILEKRRAAHRIAGILSRAHLHGRTRHRVRDRGGARSPGPVRRQGRGRAGHHSHDAGHPQRHLRRHRHPHHRDAHHAGTGLLRHPGGQGPAASSKKTETGGKPLGHRVGLLVPSSNTVMEVDFYRHLPAAATVHTGRMYMEATTVKGEEEMLDKHCLPAAADVATAKPDLMVFGCTSGGGVAGAMPTTPSCAAASPMSPASPPSASSSRCGAS